jgi:protein-S-isoprenylcysteine O-methyltransferase Ste14
MKSLLLKLVGFMILGGIAAGVISGLAGRWDLWNVWAYGGMFIVLLSFVALVEYRQNPDLLKEGLEPAAPARAQRRPSSALILVSIIQWIIAGLDQRFHWSNVIPPSGVVAGLVIFAVGWGLGAWARSVNPFYSPFVRIQEERGQRVISGGPYAIVRHPGYLGFLLVAIAGPLALNSLLSFIPALIYLATTIRETAMEDQMLRDELAGYADYTAKVRYRLLPGVW